MYLASIDYSRKYYHPNACLFPPSLSRGKSKFVRTANVSARCCIRDSSESQRQLLSTHKLNVVAFGDKRNPIFDFCFNSPRLQSKAIDFWNIYPGDSGKVHVSKNVAEESFVLSGGTTAGDIDEFFLNNAFCQSSVAFVVGAGLGSYEKSFVKFFKGVQSNGGLVVSIITKPFRFEGRKCQKEVSMQAFQAAIYYILLPYLMNCLGFLILANVISFLVGKCVMNELVIIVVYVSFQYFIPIPSRHRRFFFMFCLLSMLYL